MQVNRESFYKHNKIVKSVEKQINEAQKRGERINYLAFVPDGEPSLDCYLGKEIELLKSFGIKIAVITNATLLWRQDVREDLLRADWVSVKIDAVSPGIWQKVNRPHKTLHLDNILENIHKFSQYFEGVLTTETMLINDLNDKTDECEKIACFISEINPHKSYLSIPTRPPADKRIKPPSEHSINMAYQIFSAQGINVEYLLGYEGNTFAYTGNIEKDLLSITSVHPMRKEGVNELLKKSHADWSLMTHLINEKKLVEVEYQGEKFYLRNLPNRLPK